MANRFLNNITVNDSYTFPSTDGSSGQAIITDGAGNLTFGSATAASADSAESVHISVKNTSGAQILKGTPVYVTGETGNSGKIEVAPADASDSAKMPALGLLESTLNNNAEGFCVQGGLLEGLATDTIDGTSTTANDTVYVKAGGGLTMTKPTGSNLIQNIAKVVRVHASNGSLVVSSILRTNDVPNLPTGKIWVGDGNTTVSDVVYLDESNGRMGIGTTSPDVKFQVQGGAVKATTSDYAAPSTGGAISMFQDSNNHGTIWSVKDYNGGWGDIAIAPIGGAVRIGTTTYPDAEKLTVAGGISVSDGTYNFLKLRLGSNESIVEASGTYQNLIVGTVGTSGSTVFKTADTERMRITSGGNVGIGTTSPAFKLDVNGGSNSTPFRVLSTNTTSLRTFFEATSGNVEQHFLYTGNQDWVLGLDKADSNKFKLASADDAFASAKLTVTTSGNVGIGTTSPSYKLEVQGDFYTNGTNGALTTASSQSNLYLLNLTRTSTSLITAGNVGIGTTSPSQKLEVNGNAIIGGGTLDNPQSWGKILQVQNTGSNGAGISVKDSNNEWNLATYNGVFYISDGIEERIIINSSGNVGIGASSPGEKLEVNGNIKLFSDAPIINATSTNNSSGLRYNTTGTASDTHRFQYNGTTQLNIKSSGNVGIGTTSPGAKLHVYTPSSGTAIVVGRASGNSSIKASADADGGYLSLDSTGGATIINHYVSDNVWLVTGGGNVGIGTTSPGAKLQIGSATYAPNFNLGNNLLQIKSPSGFAYLTIGNGDVANSTSYIGGASGFTVLGSVTDAGVMSEHARITSSGGISFGSTGTAYGTSGQILKSNANASPTWVDASTVIGGPYLPLAGGTLSGDLTMDDSDVVFKHTDGFNYYRVGVGTNANFEIYNTNYGRTDLLITQSTGNATFAGTVTAPTFLGDLNGTINTVTTAVTKANSTNDTTVATTAFVQNLIGTIPAGLVFQGTWNAATNTPTLTSGTGTTGNFYIVSVDGSTSLDGITDWKVGDWAVFVEQGATDAWEKVDNSSVLDGSGTGQTVALWSGSGTSNTLTDSIITQTGSSPSQQIRITSENDAQLRLDGGTTSYAGIHWVDVSGNDYMWFNGSSGTFAIGGGGSGVSGKKLHIDGSTSIGSNYDAASPPTNGLVVEGNVGIGTTTPKAKLDVNGRFCVDSKTHNLTNAFTTCLTVNLSSHTGCYVTLTCFGDWGSHSAAAYRGEFFLQNGANAYAEPGIILRQDDNTSNGADQIVCQILDPTGTGNPKDFEIQIRTTATTGTTSFTGQLTYTVQGQFNSIT